MLLHDAHMEPQDPRLAHLQIVAQLMDRAFRVPGTRWRFGLDALLGLIPGLGDVVGSLIGTYSLLIARQLGAPPAVQGRMLLNLAIDAVVGFIPLAGDLFDFAFRRTHATWRCSSAGSPSLTQRAARARGCWWWGSS